MIEVGVYYKSFYFTVCFCDRFALKNSFRCGIFEGCKIDFVHDHEDLPESSSHED